MLKWIEIIASFFIGKMQPSHGPSLRESAIAIFEEITYKSRKAVSLVVISLAAAIFALGGFFISLINATSQYDQTGAVNFTSTLGSGLVLILIAVGTFAWVFGSAWPGVKQSKAAHKAEQEHHHHQQQEQAHQHQPSSLEYALSMLVMDFVKERELRRSESMASMQMEPDFRAPSMARAADMTNTASTLNQEPLH